MNIDPKGPAAKAGIKNGDILIKINGKEIKKFLLFLNSVIQSR
jgi:S1-C subfamily serine protease